jgi:hypothetical protein
MRAGTAALAALIGVLLPSTALADNGVHVDPGSPSQHQYVIPVNAARNETNGGHKSGSQLFGNGIKSSSSKSSSSNSSSKGTKSASGSHAKRHSAKPGSKGLHPTYALASNTRPPSGPGSSGGSGGSGWVPLVAGGALVLLLGGGGGLALRRRILRT